jgi:hypothetical protein
LILIALQDTNVRSSFYTGTEVTIVWFQVGYFRGFKLYHAGQWERFGFDAGIIMKGAKKSIY